MVIARRETFVDGKFLIGDISRNGFASTGETTSFALLITFPQYVR